MNRMMIIAGAACVAASQALRPAAAPRDWPAWLLLAIELALFAAGSSRIFRPSPRLEPIDDFPPQPGLRRWQIPLLAMSLPLSLAASMLAGQDALMRRPALAIGAYLAAIVAVIAGGWPAHWRLSLAYPNKKAALAVAVCLAAVALPLRIAYLGAVPWVMNADEGSFAMSAVRILHGQADNIFGLGVFSYPLVGFIPLALPIRLLGQTAAAARLVSALAGTATVFALYLFVRRLFNPRVALLSALFLAVFQYHIHFSRLAVHNVWDGLFYVVILACIWEAWHSVRGSHAWYLIGGLGLGFSQCFYAGARGLLLVVPAIVLGMAWRDRVRFRRALPGLGLMALAALVVFLPLGITYLRHPGEYLAPMRRVSLYPEWFAAMARDLNTTSLGVMIHQFKVSLLAFTDINFSVWYDSHAPMLLAWPAALFLLGIVLLLVRRQWKQAWLLSAWLGVIVLASALSRGSPAAQRYTAVAPAAALLVGYAISSCWDMLERLWPRAGRVWQALAVLLMVWIGWREIRHYFVDYAPRSYFDQNTASAAVLVNYLAGKPPGADVCIFNNPSMGYHATDVLNYLAPQHTYRDCSLSWEEEGHASREDSVFVFLPEYESALAPIRARYPAGELTEAPGVDSPVMMWIYDLRK